MKKDRKRTIKRHMKSYDLICETIVTDFMCKFLDEDSFKVFNYDNDIHWIGDNIGQIFDFADYCINFDDIVSDLKLDAPTGLFDQWYDETLKVMSEGKQVINYNSYIRGLRYKSMQTPIYFTKYHDEYIYRVYNLDEIKDLFQLDGFKNRLSDFQCIANTHDAKSYTITALLDNGNGEPCRIVLGVSNAELK